MDSAGLGGARDCISNELPGTEGAVDSQTTPGIARLKERKKKKKVLLYFWGTAKLPMV